MAKNIRCGSFQFEIDSLFKWVNGAYHQMVRLLRTRQLQILLCLCVTPDSMRTWITAGNLQYSMEACHCRFWCEVFCFVFCSIKISIGLIEQGNAQNIIWETRTRSHQVQIGLLKLFSSKGTKILQTGCQISLARQWQLPSFHSLYLQLTVIQYSKAS